MPRAKLTGVLCQTARDPATRGISVTAVMRPLAHTRRMALRFDLLERQRRHGPVTEVTYGKLGKWIYPANKTLGQRPGDQFIVNEPVADLAAPAYYRFRVTFRWTGAHGHVLGSAVRQSAICFQPELRPDLQVVSIAVHPNANNPRRDFYAAVIRNAGKSASGPFAVQFADGTATKTRTVASLGPHSHETMTFSGPLCNVASPPTITADPDGQIDDFRSRHDNAARTPRDVPGVLTRAPTTNQGYENRNSSRVRRGPRAVHVRQRIHHSLHQA